MIFFDWLQDGLDRERAKQDGYWVDDAPKPGQTRVVTRFLWLPKSACGKSFETEWRWLVRATYRQTFMEGYAKFSGKQVKPQWGFDKWL